MSVDRSLKLKGTLVRHRNVLTRGERVERLKEEERWQEGDKIFGLPKVVNRKVSVKKKAEAKAEAAPGTEAVAGAAGAPGAAAPAGAGGLQPWRRHSAQHHASGPARRDDG